MTKLQSNTAAKTQQDRGTEDIVYGGLCLTCENTPTCAYNRNPQVPVYYCNEFDAILENTLISSSVLNVAIPKASPPLDFSSGLCGNCDTQFTCVHAKSGRKILFCEEYA